MLQQHVQQPLLPTLLTHSIMVPIRVSFRRKKIITLLSRPRDRNLKRCASKLFIALANQEIQNMEVLNFSNRSSDYKVIGNRSYK